VYNGERENEKGVHFFGGRSSAGKRARLPLSIPLGMKKKSDQGLMEEKF